MSSEKSSWRANADTHKMRPEDLKKYGVEASKRPPGHNHKPGEVLHQRRSLPSSPVVMSVTGFAVVVAIGYFTLYAKARPGTTPSEVAKVVTEEPLPAGTRPPSK